jgi:HEAT repeat protein
MTTDSALDFMLSPSAVAANLSCLLYLARHRPDAAGELEEAARVFLASTGRVALTVESTTAWLAINGSRLGSGSPGAAQVNDHLQSHQVERVELPADLEIAEILTAARVLSAYPGFFANWGELVAALGPAGRRVRVSEGRADAPVIHHYELGGPLSPEEERRLYGELPATPVVDEAGLIPPALPAEPQIVPVPKPVGSPPPPREDPKKLAGLVARGRSAADAGDWSRLLDILREFLEAEEAAVNEAAARMYRMELRRLVGRNDIAQLARLAALGNRRDEAIAVLRRLGADATEVMMDLLVESEAMAERRGYYSAITRMADGTDVIIHHLSHPLWYVVRNAAELCGEMGLVKAVPDLARQTAHPDERVRRSIAGALTRIGAPEAIEPLARMIKDPSPAIRLYVIGNLDSERARPLAMPLAALLQQEEHPEVVREVLRALGRIGTPDALMALRNVAAGEVKRLGRKPRVQAVEALALAGPGAAPILTALSRDPEREVATAASAALASLSS